MHQGPFLVNDYSTLSAFFNYIEEPFTSTSDMDKQTFARIKEVMTFEQDDSKQALFCLYLVTGQRYTVAQSTSRIWGEDGELEEGTFYQIMPSGGLNNDERFFDWYCDNRPNNQFFTTVDKAAIHFITFWQIWQREFIKKASN